MRSGQRKGWRGTIPGQLEIPWGEPAKQGTNVSVSPLPASLPISEPVVPPLVQFLPWDFQITFPLPLPEAIDAGTIPEEDTTPEGIRSIHDEHARQTLATLHDLDALRDARSRGIDPITGKIPRTAAARARLQKRFDNEPARLEHAVEVLMDVYETVFGAVAANAFIKAIRAWHAGIKVEVEPPSKPRMPIPLDGKAEQVVNPSTEESPSGAGRTSASRRRRVVARLPVPLPLPSAIAAGHFGQEEDGRPIRPGTHEVREITEQHAEKLVGLLDAFATAPAESKTAILSQFDRGIRAYAEDFGSSAAEQLEAYVRRQASLDRGDRHER